MARIRDNRPAPRETQDSHAPVHEFTGLVLLASGLVIFLSLISYAPADLPAWLPFHHSTSGASKQTLNFLGVVGSILAFVTYSFLGSSAYLLCAMLLGYGSAKLILPGTRLSKRALWSVSFVCSGACLAHLLNIPLIDAERLALASEGGWFGKFVGGTLLQTALGSIGALAVLLVLYGASILYMTGVEPREVLQLLTELPPKGLELLKEWLASRAEKRAMRQAEMEMPVARPGRRQDFPPETPKNTRRRSQPPSASSAEEVIEDPDETQARPEHAQELITAEVLRGSGETTLDSTDASLDASSKVAPSESAAPPQEPARPAPKIIDGTAPQTPRPRDSKKKTDFSLLENVSCEGYQLPPIDLLDCVDESTREAVDPADLLSLQNTLVETLQQFGIEVSPGDITRGPTITRYEVYPAKGVRVDRILALERDLARATRAERINILAPIPGKDTVGIEIANSKKQKVTLRELFESEDFASAKAKIPIALGKDVYGKTIVADLAAMPHGLVAGTTGSGKSVCINAIIASILYRFTPEELRFIMIDPKVVEMQMYNTLPHLVVPVVTDPKKVLLALRWAVDEMEKRYAIFAKTGVRNIASFNSRPKPKTQKELDEEKKAKHPELFDEALQPAVLSASKPSESAELDEADDEPALAIANAMSSNSIPPDSGVVLRDPDSDASENPGKETTDDAERQEDDQTDESESAKEESGPSHPSDEEGEDDRADAVDIPIEEQPVEERIAAMTTVRVPRETDLRIPEKMSYIVIIVDELADLMQTAPADVESAIARITQKARAAGIHMIIATQTPRADVITGVIKANVPCRVAFQVASALDSRVILDENGAEKLLGQGDMLYRPPGTSRMVRAQGVLVTDEEVKRLVEFSSNQGGPKFENSIQARLQGGGDGEGDEVSDEDEELVDKCIEIMQQEKKASTSLFQRRLRLGYTRAARILDILENRGYVGPGEGAKPREILVDLDTL